MKNFRGEFSELEVIELQARDDLLLDEDRIAVCRFEGRVKHRKSGFDEGEGLTVPISGGVSQARRTRQSLVQYEQGMAHGPISGGREAILALLLFATVVFGGSPPSDVFLDRGRGHLNRRLTDLAAVIRKKFSVLYEKTCAGDSGLSRAGIVRAPLAFAVAREEQGLLGLQ